MFFILSDQATYRYTWKDLSAVFEDLLTYVASLNHRNLSIEEREDVAGSSSEEEKTKKDQTTPSTSAHREEHSFTPTAFFQPSVESCQTITNAHFNIEEEPSQ